MTDLERARKVFSGDRFAVDTVGCVIEEARAGYARCCLTVAAGHMNSLGRAMGGAVYTLADFAFGVASNFDRDVFVTTTSEIHFLAPSAPGRLTAEAREVRSGRRTCLFEITVTNEAGETVAFVTAGGMLIQKRKGSVKP